MGLIDSQINGYVQNASKCLTWPAVEESHTGNGKTVVFKVEDLYGILVLLSLGFSGALLAWVGEIMIYLNRLFAKKKANHNENMITQAWPVRLDSSNAESSQVGQSAF